MRRTAAVAAAAFFTACGQPEAPPPLPEPPAQAVNAPWFICDGVDAPAFFVFEREGDQVRVAEYDKPNGAIIERREYVAGAPEGAAGGIYTPLMQEGAQAGAVRTTNAGMLESPGAAYTTPVTSVQFGDRRVSCRWMPRTRLIGVTGRRAVVVHEDRDGDLIYTAYNFTDAASAQPIDLSENARTTTFSAEIRGGEENTTPEGSTFRFENNGFAYIVTANRDGTGGVSVMRGADEVQNEPLTAYQLGSAAP